jgi:GntR family transcriptional regulator
MITINYQNRKPIYEQIVDRFQTLILTGAIPADSQLPSVRSLAVELSINPNTIQKAYSVLEKEGYIYPVKGKGNFVSGNQELKAKKQEVFYRSLGQLVEQGKVLDIKKKDFLEKAEAFYEEGQV